MTDALTRAAIEAHKEWLGFVQPTGLVVAEPVLVERGVILDRHARPRQERFKELLDGDEQRLTDIRALFTDFLGWEADDLAAPADELHIRLPELGVTLEPSFAVADPDGGTQLLIRVEPDGTNLDEPVPARVDGWTAPPQARFERLLRQTEIPTGLLCTPQAVRLVHAPKGETSGHITFRAADMATVMGRPILAALDLLLGAYRFAPRHASGCRLCSRRAARPRTWSRASSPDRCLARFTSCSAASSRPMRATPSTASRPWRASARRTSTAASSPR